MLGFSERVKSCRAGVVPIIVSSSFLLSEGAKCSRVGSIFQALPLLSWRQVIVSCEGRRKQCHEFGRTIRVLCLADIDPWLSFSFGTISLVEVLTCNRWGSDQCHNQCCHRFWRQGSSSGAYVLLRWGLGCLQATLWCGLIPKLMVRAKFQQPLTIVTAFSYSEVTETVGLSFVVATNTCIEIAQYD